MSYESRAKAVMKVSNVASNTQLPSVFMTEGGLADANRILTDYHRHAMSEANKAKDIERDVIQALNGLRADLGAKIKEIKNLHGDFKNSVDKEKDLTKRAILSYQESVQHYEHSDSFDKGRSDPFIIRLNVDRMIEKQIDEENYLHRVSSLFSCNRVAIADSAGLSQPRKFGSRTRVYRSRRDPEGIQRIGGHHKAGRR